MEQQEHVKVIQLCTEIIQAMFVPERSTCQEAFPRTKFEVILQFHCANFSGEGIRYKTVVFKNGTFQVNKVGLECDFRTDALLRSK